MRISKKQIDKWVVEAIEMVPRRLIKRMHNLVFEVDDRPTRAQIREYQVKRGYALFGLYQGYEQTSFRQAAVSDKITIFRNPILESAKTLAVIKKKVYETVWHEISHHFGSSETQAERAEKRMFERYQKINRQSRTYKKEVKKMPRVAKRRRGYKRKTKVTYKIVN